MRRLREGDMRMARALAVQALAHSCDDPFAAGAALLVAHATADAALVNDVDAAACWERVRRDGNVAAIAFFGGAYASTIGDAFAAREILEAVFRKTPPVAASIEALLAAAECGDRALAANVLARIATIAADAPPELRAVAAHAAALIGRTGDDAAGAHTAAIQAQRDYARAGWAYYAARAAELAGDARAAQSAYRRAGAVHDVARLAAAERPDAADTLSMLARRERDVATLIAAGLANKEIAARLNISVKTVEKNVTAIYAKLGITRRVQLARLLAPKPDREAVNGNLPEPLTPFIGRADELAEPPRHLQGLPGVLAEVVGGIHQDGVPAHPLSHCPFRMISHVSGDLAHYIAVLGPVRPGTRRQAAGVGADQPGPVPGRYHGQPRIRAAPGVVEQVSARSAGLAAHLRIEHNVGVRQPGGFVEESVNLGHARSTEEAAVSQGLDLGQKHILERMLVHQPPRDGLLKAQRHAGVASIID